MKSSKDRRQSSSSEDSLPVLKLKLVQSYFDENSYECLQTYKVVTCDFCDEVFFNRYNYLIHNAKHIIIPLLKLPLLRCNYCSLQFRTEKKFKRHVRKKHPSITIPHHKLTNGYSESQIAEGKSEIAVWGTHTALLESNIAKNSEISDNAVKESAYTSQESHVAKWGTDVEIKKSQIAETGITKRRSDIREPLRQREDDIMNDDHIIIIESDSDEGNNEKFDYEEVAMDSEKIRNRLVFEDDILNPNTLAHDLVADCKVNLDFQPPWLTCDFQENLPQIKDVISLNVNDVYESVHYEELIETEKTKCRYCKKAFSNRFSAIKHETTHMKIKNKSFFFCRHCDWYISDNIGTLLKHIKRKHAGEPKVTRIPARCKKCNLRFVKYSRHYKNYHQLYHCFLCSRSFEFDAELAQHVGEHDRGIEDHPKKPQFITKLVKVCELCHSFFKTVTNLVYYKDVGDFSELGKRHVCERCNRQFFNLKIVQLDTRAKCSWKLNDKKVTTNVDRLKKFKKRLKNMNK